MSSDVMRTERNLEPLLMKIGDILTDGQFSILINSNSINENIEGNWLIYFIIVN